MTNVQLIFFQKNHFVLAGIQPSMPDLRHSNFRTFFGTGEQLAEKTRKTSMSQTRHEKLNICQDEIVLLKLI